MSEEEQQLRRDIRRVAENVLSNSRFDYDGQVKELRRLRRIAHEELAGVFAPAFNAALERIAHDDLDSKRALCSAANEALKELGLAIRDPRSGQPAILVADMRASDDDRGRFRLEVREPSGRVIRTLSSATLVQFELCPAAVRHESFARRFRGPESGEPNR